MSKSGLPPVLMNKIHAHIAKALLTRDADKMAQILADLSQIIGVTIEASMGHMPEAREGSFGVADRAMREAAQIFRKHQAGVEKSLLRGLHS